MEEGLGGRKKNFPRLGAHLVFCDESGFLLIPSVRRPGLQKAKPL
jgi:hypothetical protein